MWDWIGSGLASLFGGGADAAAAAASDAPTFLADPSFTLSGDGFTDIAGNPVSGATNFNGTSFNLGTTGIDGAPLRDAVYDAASGKVIGFNDGAGNLVDLNGNPVTPTSFGGFNPSLGGGPQSLQDAINGVRPNNPFGGGSGGGSGATNVSMPKLDVPQSGIVPMTPSPAMASAPVPQTPQSSAPSFTPVVSNVATAQAPADMQGLRRLFEARGAV